MLKALEDVVERFKHLEDEGESNAYLDQARAVINKAKGIKE